MGQQQMLLLALAIIIVGAAVAVGVNMFSEGTQAMDYDKFYHRASVMATKFSEWYSKPIAMGGGAGDVTNFPTDNVDQSAAILGISSNSNSNTIHLTGVEVGPTVTDINNSSKTHSSIDVTLSAPDGSFTASVVLSAAGRTRWEHSDSSPPAST